MSDVVKYRCPYLGLANDPATWFAFPAEGNYCHLRRNPRAVETTYQRDFCLSDNYPECPLLASQKQTDSVEDRTDGGEQKPAQPRLRPALWIGGTLAFVLITGIVLVFGSSLSSFIAPAPEPPTSTPTLQPTETLTATPVPTSTPTATASPTATTEPTVEATGLSPADLSPAATEFIVLTLAFDSYIRSGPGRDFATVAYLSAGTLVTIIGRDLDGFWLLVRLADGREGWVALTQFPADTVNIKAIPVAPEIPTPYVTVTSRE